MRHTPEQVKEAVTSIPNLSTEDLAHQYKCCRTQDSAKEKALYKPFLTAAEKELRARSKAVKSLDEIAAEDAAKAEAEAATKIDYD